MKSRNNREQPYGPIYRRYPFLNFMSRAHIAQFARDAHADGHEEFAAAAYIVITTDTTRFRKVK